MRYEVPLEIEYGVTIVVWWSKKEATVACKPSFRDTCNDVINELRNEGVKIREILNTGVDDDLKKFNEVEDLYFRSDSMPCALIISKDDVRKECFDES